MAGKVVKVVRRFREHVAFQSVVIAQDILQMLKNGEKKRVPLSKVTLGGLACALIIPLLL